MTREQALAVLEVLPLSSWRQVIVGLSGLDGDAGQLMLATPAGPIPVVVELPGPLPLPVEVVTDLAARTESRIRNALATFEVDVGRGYNGDGRGALRFQPGYRAADGWV